MLGSEIPEKTFTSGSETLQQPSKDAMPIQKSKGKQERTFLVVLDNTPEMHVALRYACRCVRRLGGRVSLLYVQEPAAFQHWSSVGQLMRQEGRKEAEDLLRRLSHDVHHLSGEMPVLHLREGETKDQILALLREDVSISALVLGASTGSRGPGPLVSELVGNLISSLKLPVMIVPGHLESQQIDRMI